MILPSYSHRGPVNTVTKGLLSNLSGPSMMANTEESSVSYPWHYQDEAQQLGEVTGPFLSMTWSCRPSHAIHAVMGIFR